MITKEDAKNYLKKMLDVEEAMYKGYQEMASKVSDQELKDIFLKLSNDEVGHSKLVNDLIDLLDKNVK